MKVRLRKKYKGCTCIHFYQSELYLVTDDPYMMYGSDIYCKINPNKDFSNHEPIEDICFKCKNFYPLKQDMKDKLKTKRDFKKEEQWERQYNLLNYCKHKKELESFDVFNEKFNDIFNDL